jgi:hypothetical protein
MLTREYERGVETAPELSLLSLLSGVSARSASAASPVVIRAMDTLGRQATVPKTGRNFAYEVVIPELLKGNEVVISLSGMYVNYHFVWGIYVTLYKSLPESLVDCVSFRDFATFMCDAREVKQAKEYGHFYVYDRVNYELLLDRTEAYMLSEGYISEPSPVNVDPFKYEEEDFSDVWPVV